MAVCPYCGSVLESENYQKCPSCWQWTAGAESEIPERKAQEAGQLSLWTMGKVAAISGLAMVVLTLLLAVFHVLSAGSFIYGITSLGGILGILMVLGFLVLGGVVLMISSGIASLFKESSSKRSAQSD